MPTISKNLGITGIGDYDGCGYSGPGPQHECLLCPPGFSGLCPHHCKLCEPESS